MFNYVSTRRIFEPIPVPLEALESCCKHYMGSPSDVPFTLSVVTVDAEFLKKQKTSAAMHVTTPSKGGSAGESAPGALSTRSTALKSHVDCEADLLSKLPQFVHIGVRFSSSKRVALSESGTEYEVHCTKHVYSSHLLLQFSLSNTLDDQLLEDVTVDLDLSGIPGLALDTELRCASLPFGVPGDAFVCLRRLEGMPTGSLGAALKFLVKDVDPANGKPLTSETSYDDVYQLEDLEICAADFMKKVHIWNRAVTEAQTFRCPHVHAHKTLLSCARCQCLISKRRGRRLVMSTRSSKRSR
jgi:coatomer protein complex subunit gamma